jgi:hypothetical protein
MKSIAIIIPTRERNHKIKKLHEQWFNILDPNVSTDCVIVLDSDNEKTYDRLPGFIYHVINPNPNGSKGAVYPLNEVANKIYNDYEYLGFWGDDHYPQTQNWNSIMYEVLCKNAPFSMVYCDDLIQGEKLPTEIIMDSLFIEEFKFMAHPSLTHLYCDDIWKYTGQKVENLHYISHVIIEHLHCCVGKSENDNMYQINNSSECFSLNNAIYNTIIHSQEFNEKLNEIKNKKEATQKSKMIQ